MKADSTKEFNILDHLGSVRVSVTIKINSISYRHYDYKPFGDTISTSNGRHNTFEGYEGEERDMESRMMNYGMRMYEPTLGRFLSVDRYPTVWVWQGFRSLSPYQYAYNSPLSYKDPTGLAPQKEQGEKVLRASLQDEIQALMEASNALREENEYHRLLSYNSIVSIRSYLDNWHNFKIAEEKALGSAGGGGSNSNRGGTNESENGTIIGGLVSSFKSAWNWIKGLLSSDEENVIDVCMYEVITAASDFRFYGTKFDGKNMSNANQLAVVFSANPVGAYSDYQFFQTVEVVSVDNEEPCVDKDGNPRNQPPFFNTSTIKDIAKDFNTTFSLAFMDAPVRAELYCTSVKRTNDKKRVSLGINYRNICYS